jgi:hypothetical protein
VVRWQVAGHNENLPTARVSLVPVVDLMESGRIPSGSKNVFAKLYTGTGRSGPEQITAPRLNGVVGSLCSNFSRSVRNCYFLRRPQHLHVLTCASRYLDQTPSRNKCFSDSFKSNVQPRMRLRCNNKQAFTTSDTGGCVHARKGCTNACKAAYSRV